MEYPDQAAIGVGELVTQHIREPESVTRVDGNLVWVFNPPLTAAEQTALDNLTAWLRSGLNVSFADYPAIRTNLQTLRDLRQLGRPAFLAQTTAQKERQLYDALVADTILWLAVLRE